MIVCSFLFFLVCLNTCQGLELDSSKFEKLVVLPRSNKIPNVDQAADGDTTTCIEYRRQPRKNARVWIDLQGLHNVHRVIVRHSGIDSNSDLQMMKNIQIKLSNTTSASKKKDCFTNYDDIPSDGALDTSTNCLLQSTRSVYVIRPTELRFCEVEVYGCVSGRWGASCENSCGACAGGDVCDSVTGHCSGACAQGWSGILCNIATETTTPQPTMTTSATITTITQLTTTAQNMSSIASTLVTSSETIVSGTTIDTKDENTLSSMPSRNTPDVVIVSTGAPVISGKTTEGSGVSTEETSESLQFETVDEKTTQSTETPKESSFSGVISPVTSGNTEMNFTSGTRVVMTSTTENMSVKQNSETATMNNPYSSTESMKWDSYTTGKVTNYGVSSEDGHSAQILNVTSNPKVTEDENLGTTRMIDSPTGTSSISTTTSYFDWSHETHSSTDDLSRTTKDIDDVSFDMQSSDVMTDSSVTIQDKSSVSSGITVTETVTDLSVTSQDTGSVSSGITVTETVTDLSVTSQDTGSVSSGVYPTGTVTDMSVTSNITEIVTKATQVLREVGRTFPDSKKTPACKGFTCSQNNLVVLVGIVVALLFIATIIATVYMVRRRARNKRNRDFEKGDSFKTFNGLPLPDITAAAKAHGSNGDITSNKLEDNLESANQDDCSESTSFLVPCNLSSFSPSQAKPTAVGDIHGHIMMMKERSLFNKDFTGLPGVDISSCHVGTSKRNSTRNRYSNITTFDHSRVVLATDKEEENDYINASYIDSFEQPRAYIATQGPLKHTTDDFWNMVWQERSEKIAMLTELQENGKKKCVQYWPEENERLSVGSLTVTLENEYHFPIYKLRTFFITDCKTHECRKVTQFQFTAWPDHGVPEGFPLILFHDRVINQPSSGPMVVHCSAGVGRTGTFIALDALSEQGRKTGHVTIHLFVEYMRRCRPRMVQTLDQYMFLYNILMEKFLCSSSLVEAESLRETWKLNSGGVHEQKIREEFERLQEFRPRYSGEKYMAAHKKENSSKNGTTVLPVDTYRVKLDSSENDYINAVTMPNLGSKSGYIVTEIPLSTSKANFWQMIHEQKCNVIVSFDQPLDETGVSILPETDQEQTFGAFTIRRGDSAIGGPHGIQRETYIMTCDNEENEVAVFYLAAWGTEDILPPTCASLISLHQETQKWQENKGQGRVTVICRDGAERCGLYCTVCNMMECIDWYNSVDIFHTVRHLQICRPEIINSLVQYSCCFDVALAYTDISDGTSIKLPNNTVFVFPTTSV
ncbi:receptor-type tyrosine-protein phosphatase T-like [Ylistrum balloti]|uniref:receptor-type tyrosine-protein phosphatase T-like n=1 Tax=Ylistrum balloti TaxID=509963 RepID=UPI0029059804|nr:receptor-type tyrosine-protein phosphatase T-like [Ylistrum balloti]